MNKKYGIINGGNVVINNSTISGNRNLIGSYWDTLGGGIWNGEGGSVFINNCTIVDNWSRIYGGGVYNEPGGIVNLRNSILVGNTSFRSGLECWGTITSIGYNLIGDTQDCTFIPATGDLTNVDADLGQLVGLPGAPTYHPLFPSSPAIDAGDPSGCTDNLGNPLDIDQRGAARVGRCDIGAYEYRSPSSDYAVHEYSGNNQRTPPNQTFHIPLEVVILDGIGSPVSNLTTTFRAPADGPNAVFFDSGTYSMTMMTDSGGIAKASYLTANDQKGFYTVTVSATGALKQAEFSLGNLGWYVNPLGDDENDCQSVLSPCATIQGALDKVGFLPGDTLMAASGVYTGTGAEAVLVEKDAYMRGGWNENFTEQGGNSIIDGQHARPGMSVRNEYEFLDVEVERFTFQNG
jgi:hypothetical protein